MQIIGLVVLVLLSYISLLYVLPQNKCRMTFVNLIPYLFFYICYVTIYVLVGENTKLFFIDFIVVILSMVTFNVSSTYFRTREDFLTIINNIVRVFVVVSLFFYFLGSLTKTIHPTSNVDVMWGQLFSRPSYFGLHYDYQQVYLNGRFIPRNSGVFLEAGIFSFYIAFALLIELFHYKKRNWKWIIVLVLGLLTTFSTTSYIIMSFLAIMMLMVYKPSNNYLKGLKSVFLILVTSVAVIFSYKSLDAKINNEVGNRSFEIRIDDIRLGYEAFKLHKVLGLGYKDSSEYMELQSKDIRGENISGGSNGWMIILYQGGIYLLILYIVLLCRSYIYLKKMLGKLFANILAVFLMIEFASLPIPYFWIVFWIYCFGFMNLKDKKVDYAC
ncbi:O-antigen ligase family protein [Aeribacillus composti]|uniref:O-antigen ligase family protein n=1 Tax=Aeribacillus composti TaxID=1868734 RepID=UPI00406A7CEE